MAINYSTGINTYYLLKYLTDISQLEISNDIDTADISQDLVLQFIKEGYQRIIALDGRWPWYQSVYTFDTVNNQRSYSNGFTLTATAADWVSVPQPNKSLADIKEVINVVNNTNSGNELIYLDQFKAEQIWVGTNDTANIPAYWSLWAGKINLWPKPNDVYSITIRAYRQPSFEWLNQLDENSTFYVDLDTEFHMMLVNWVMMRIFQYDEDPEMAAVYQRHFEQGVSIAKANLTAPNSNQPLILSGGLQLTPGYWWSDTPYLRVLPGNPWPIGQAY